MDILSIKGHKVISSSLIYTWDLESLLLESLLLESLAITWLNTILRGQSMMLNYMRFRSYFYIYYNIVLQLLVFGLWRYITNNSESYKVLIQLQGFGFISWDCDCTCPQSPFKLDQYLFFFIFLSYCFANLQNAYLHFNTLHFIISAIYFIFPFLIISLINK